MGHSLGASVAQLAAARHPTRVDRVVAVGPALGPDACLEAVLDHWASLARSSFSDRELHRGLVLPAFGRDAFERLVPAVLEDMSRHPPARDTVLRYVECNRAQDLRPVAGRIDAPVLVVAGAEDALTGPGQARAVAEAIPGALLELIPTCGHMPQVEQPTQLSRVLLSFLLKR